MPLEWQEIARFGQKIVAMGLTSSRFGNISILQGDKIFITCTGSMLDELDQNQIVEVDLSDSSPKDGLASSETVVHRSVYQNNSAKAIIHTHSPFAVALSLLENDAVNPIDSEGCFFLGSMPIVQGHFGTNDLAKSVSEGLRCHKACIARGHGVFACGTSLVEAFSFVCMAEHSSQVRYLVKSYPRQINENDD